MARQNKYEQYPIFEENTQELSTPEYRMISKLSLTPEQQATYVKAIQEMSGLNGNKWNSRITNYFRQNDKVIDTQQEGLNAYDLKPIFRQYSDVIEEGSNQHSEADISVQGDDYTQVSSVDQVLDKIIDQNIGNSINPEGEKNVQIDELDDVINTEQSTLSPEQKARVDSYQSQYQTRKANENDYFRGYTLPEWLHIEVDSEEHNKLKEAIKELGVMPKLGELDTIIKAQHQSNEISGNYLSFINATRELYGLNPLQTTAEVEELLESLPDDREVEPIPVESEAQSQYYIVEGSRFNLSRYNGNDEMRLANIKDDLSELGISGIELDELISSRGFPDIPSKSIKIGDKIVDWDDEDPESRLSYRESAIAEYYGIDTNKGMFTDETQATEDKNIREKITYGNMNNKAWKNLNTGETSQTFGRLPDTNTEEEPSIEGRATRRRSSADGGEISSIDELQPSIIEPEASTPENSGLKHSTEASSDAVAGRVVQDKALNVEPLPEIAVDGVEDDNVTGGEPEVNQGTSQQISEAEVTDQTNPDLDELQSELSRLVTEAANKLNIEQEQENKTEYSELNQEEIERLKENAKQAIQKYKDFGDSHAPDLRTPQIQDMYRQLEQQAWCELERLANKLGANILTLPQEKVIKASHPEDINFNTRAYLESDLGYKFNQEGEITHIQINGNTIELNRPRSIDELLNRSRPVRIIYHREQYIEYDENNEASISKGSVIEGLNQHTVNWIERSLGDKKFLEPVIIDETKRVSEELPEQTPDEVVEEKPQPTIGKEPPIMPIFQVEDGVSPTFNTQGKYSLEDKFKQEPWFEDSKGETAFNKIFADSLKNKDEISGNVGTPDPWLERTEQPEVETADIPQTHPDFGSLYYQESQRWNHLQSLEEQYRENPKDKEIEKDLTEMRQTYQDFIDRINNDPNQDKFRDFLALRQSYANEEASNTMDRFRKAIGLSQHNETELALSRERYNTALQELLKTEVSDKVSLNIKQLFSDEFSRLRDERAQQTRELKGPETRIDRLKNKFFKFATKHKSIISGVNFLLLGGSLFAAGTGIGIPVAGAMDVSRRFIGGVMAGVSGRETIRSNFEDLNTDLNVNLTKGINIKTNFNILKSNNKDRNLNLNIKGINFKTNFERLKTKGAITKLVEKSLKGDYINKASDTELLKIISTLDAYYGLNGGRFTESNQQKAYEMATYALGKKVENSIQPNSETSDTLDANSTSSKDEVSIESNSNTQDIAQSPDYMNELLTRVSIDRVRELNKQKNIRLGANTAGFLIGGTLLSSLAADMHRPGGMFNPNDTPDTEASTPKTESGSVPGGAPTGESVTPKPTTEPISPNPLETPGTGGLGEPPSAPDAPLTGAGEALSQSDQLAQSAEATRAAAEQAAQQAAEQAAEQLAQDVSSLDPGETIWGEVAKQLGENATDTQIQQAVENLLQSAEGQDSIYKLAQGTEGGRALLSQWGIDNASEMAILSKEQLYEISRYLAPGELQGITELSLDNLTPFEAVEPPQVDVSEAMGTPADTPVAEAPTPSVEPTSSASPAAPVSPEVTAPTETTAFTQELSEILGKSNLTEIQARDMIQNYFVDDYGREAIYKSLAQNPEGAQFLSKGFGVNSSLDFASLTPEQMYEISQSINPADLEKIINESLLSKFEMADVVDLAKGDTPLGAVNRYISNELGNLPYDSTLGQQVLNTYINTPAGKEWLYESIVSNPNPNNQNVQMFREYLSFKGIKSAEEFKQTFDWAEFSGNKRIPTSAFWNYTRLPNGNMRIAPLSTFLQPGKMVGIPEAIRQVLTKQ
jgi:hypothetical protein